MLTPTTQPSLRTVVLLFVLLVGLLSSPGAGRAAPQITVKGRTSIRILGIYPTERAVVLVGRLLDRELGVGIADRSVEVNLMIDGRRRPFRVPTDAEGEFRVELPSGAESYRLEAHFSGDATYAEDRPPPTEMDITKLTPEIQLEMQRELSLSRPRNTLQIMTRAEGRNVSLPVRLELDPGVDLGLVTTGPTGQATIQIPTARFGAPGSKTLVARFAGDSEFNPVRTQIDLMLYVVVKVTLRASASSVHSDDEMQLTGTVSDDGGAIAGATVGLEAMGRQISTTLSDGAGGFHFRLKGRDFPPGPLDLVASYTPSVTHRRPSSSPAVQVMVLPPTPIPARLYAIPVVFTALVMIALLLSRFWPTLRRHRAPATETVTSEPALQPVASGAQMARTSLRSLVNPATDVHGTVYNPVDHCPIPHARIVFEGHVELVSDAEGRFAVADLPAGVHRVVVSKPGFVSESFRATIPHRGGLHSVRVDLVEVRVRLLEVYREAALELLPAAQLWARWTPRELTHHVGSRAGQRELNLEQLTRMLEQAYWAGWPAQEGVLPGARTLAQKIQS